MVLYKTGKGELMSAIIEKLDYSMFDELAEFINNDSITDIDWNGYDLWLTDFNKGKYLSEKKVTDEFIDNLAIKLSNTMNVSFNRQHQVLEANTTDRRISIFHESVAGKKSLCIRKNPMFLRLKRTQMIESGYCDENILNLIENCVIAHFNIIVGGLPNAGKTELVKYLTTFIPANEKAGIYEDTKEIHYRTIHPEKDCIEISVNETIFPYDKAIKAGLRHNIKWTILSEARDREVLQLMNNLSTGSNCLTTIHTDNVKSIPDRMFNMLGECSISDRYINNIYRYLDVGILVDCNDNRERHIVQTCFFVRECHTNSIISVLDEGVLASNLQLPESILHKFRKYQINDIFKNYKKQERVGFE